MMGEHQTSGGGCKTYFPTIQQQLVLRAALQEWLPDAIWRASRIRRGRLRACRT